MKTYEVTVLDSQDWLATILRLHIPAQRLDATRVIVIPGERGKYADARKWLGDMIRATLRPTSRPRRVAEEKGEAARL